jgi:hypothetical protein
MAAVVTINSATPPLGVPIQNLHPPSESRQRLLLNGFAKVEGGSPPREAMHRVVDIFHQLADSEK